MGDPETLESGAIDTVAACHAAAGHFDKAAELQKLALSKTLQVPSGSEMEKKFQARLAMYQRKQPYIETKANTPTP
jgi:hypothetical protein